MTSSSRTSSASVSRYRVKVVRVETINVDSKKRALGFCENGQKDLVRLLCLLAKACAAAMQTGVDGGNAGDRIAHARRLALSTTAANS
jgi:hypothetical protein